MKNGLDPVSVFHDSTQAIRKKNVSSEVGRSGEEGATCINYYMTETRIFLYILF